MKKKERETDKEKDPKDNSVETRGTPPPGSQNQETLPVEGWKSARVRAAR